MTEDTSSVFVDPFKNEKLLRLVESALMDEKVIDWPIMLENKMELVLIVQVYSVDTWTEANIIVENVILLAVIVDT